MTPQHSIVVIGTQAFVLPLLLDLMYAIRRKRSADQSSSIATCRTVSKPASRSTSQPVSRLKSQRYRFEVPLG